MCAAMTSANDERRAWDVIEKVGVCMMTTRFSDGLRARPMEAQPSREEGLIYFLTDVRAAKDDEIEQWPHTCLAFIDPEEKVYLSVSGRAKVVDDRGKIDDLWSDEQQAFWPDGPRDANVRLVSVEPELIEFWDGPASAAAATHEFRKARATGEKPNLGEKRKKKVEPR